MITAGAIIGILFILFGFVNGVSAFGEDENEAGVLSFLIEALGIWIFIMCLVFEDDYKQGQVDVLEGNVKYKKEYKCELKDSVLVKTDSSWVEINK